MVELVRRLLGSDAAAAAKDRFGRVAAALRGGASAFASTVVAAFDAACSATVSATASAREALAAMLPELAPGKAVASVVAEIRALVGCIPTVEGLLGTEIPWEVKAAIAVVAVAAGLYLALCAANAGAPAAAAAAAMMKAPGSGALPLAVLRSAFEANPALYLGLLRSVGPLAAAVPFRFFPA